MMVIVYGVAAVASGATMALQRPWIARLARRSAPPDVQDTPSFHSMTYLATAVWTALFAVAAALAALLPGWVNLITGAVMLVAGLLSPRVSEAYVVHRWSAEDERVRRAGSSRTR